MFKKTDKGINRFTLWEFPKTVYVESIWKHPDIYTHQVNRFKLYCDEALESNMVKVEYIMKKPYGRYFVKDAGKISSCPMWGVLRSSLFKETEDDIDIVACHQSLLYDL